MHDMEIILDENRLHNDRFEINLSAQNHNRTVWVYGKIRISACGGEAREGGKTMNIAGLKTGIVTAVSLSAAHTFSKERQDRIRLLAGLGVEGDAHMGETVKHRSRVAQDPTQPNLRQVHLIHAELHEELREAGFDVAAGQMGENITTRGVELLRLPRGTRLHLGETAVVEVTGLRNPCPQLDHFRQGLLAAVLGRDEQGNLTRKAGIMGIVLEGGVVQPGDLIRTELPPEPHAPLERV
jgi:MOSC domain-containing protein YiiM